MDIDRLKREFAADPNKQVTAVPVPPAIETYRTNKIATKPHPATVDIPQKPKDNV